MLKKAVKTSLLLIVLLLVRCTYTGICTEPITPKLIIGFTSLDKLNNEVEAPVPSGLRIQGSKDGENIEGENGEYIYPDLMQADEKKQVSLFFDVNRDSIMYIFKFIEEKKGVDSLPIKTTIEDTLKLKYLRKQVFVNEDCGYKSIFYNVDIESTKNKILKAKLLAKTIEYDNTQHIKILVRK